MKAVIYRGPRDFRVEDIAEPKIEQAKDAIVKITNVAICGSDLHIYHGDMPQTPGMPVGHEYVGVVAEVGAGVTGFKKGDRIVGSFNIACGTCPNCRSGLWHQCRYGGVLGYGPMMGNLPGVQAEFGRIPFADINLRKIPDGVDEKKALFCGDNLSTVFGALKNVQFQAGESVAVIGCGPIGLQAVQTAVALGAGQVVALDMVADRLKQAEAFGAKTIDVGKDNVAEASKQLTQKRGFAVVVEAVGGPKTLETAFTIVGQGGRVTAVGVSNAPTFPFPLLKALTFDLTFRTGLANIHRDIDQTLALVSAGRIDPSKVLSHEIPLKDAVKAYEMFDRREATKIFLVP